jgi:hypothetical protein
MANKEVRREWYEKNKEKLAEYNRNWRKANVSSYKEKKRKYNELNKEAISISRRERHLRLTYNLTIDEYENLLKSQNSECGICKEPFTKRPHIDHDHVTGKVRGLLCGDCNVALGGFKDNVNFLQNAIDYLNINTGF